MRGVPLPAELEAPTLQARLEHLFGGVGLHDDTEQASALVPTNSELLGLDLAKDSGHGDERTLRDADDAATPIEVGLKRQHEIGGHHRNRTVAEPEQSTSAITPFAGSCRYSPATHPLRPTYYIGIPFARNLRARRRPSAYGAVRAYLRRRALVVRSLRFDARRLPHAAVSVAVSACAIVNSI